jgi:hypothetical protein
LTLNSPHSCDEDLVKKHQQMLFGQYKGSGRKFFGTEGITIQVSNLEILVEILL